MKIRLMTMMVLVCLITGLYQVAAVTDTNTQYALAQAADLQFTEDTIYITVEQGASNTGAIRVHNYGDAVGSANISFAGLEPDGITVVLSTHDIVDVYPDAFQEVIVTVSAAADLWPLGPRRLDMQLVNLTTGDGFDDLALEMNVVAPSTTTNPGIFGISMETIVLSIVATAVVIIIVVWLRRK